MEQPTGKDTPSSHAPAARKRKELHDLIEAMETAMLTTRRPDGHLVSRPMAVQRQEGDADLWFVTDGETHKMDELAHDPNVNAAFYRDGSREWVSVSGRAEIVRDRARIRELWAPDWKAWFPDEGGDRDGGPDDPRLALIRVDADAVVYMKVDTPKPVVLFEVVKGMVTGSTPDVGEVRSMGERELEG